MVFESCSVYSLDMDIDTILDYFETVDPILARTGREIASKLTPQVKQPSKGYLSDLCESIVSQQLSVKAASTIWARTHGTIRNWNDPNHIISARTEDLRTCGLSGQKIGYVRNIADAVLNQKLHLARFNEMTDQETIDELVQIKGIGQWTAEMFLIFSLGREDIFSSGDLGLRNGIKMLYSLESVTPRSANEISLKWAPYRSYASRILWKTLDNEPVTV